MKKPSLIILAALLAISLGACDDKKSADFPGYQPVQLNGKATAYLFETDTIEQVGMKRGFRFVQKMDGSYLVQPAVTDCHGHVTYKTGSTFNNDGSGHKIHDPSPAKAVAAAGTELDALLHDVCNYSRYADPLAQTAANDAAKAVTKAEPPVAAPAAATPPLPDAGDDDSFDKEDAKLRAAAAPNSTPPADEPVAEKIALNGVWDGDWDTSVAKDAASFPDKSFKTWVEKLHVEISGDNAHFINSTNDVTCKLKHKDKPVGEIDLVSCHKKTGATAKFIFTLAQRGSDLTYVLSGTQNSYIYLKKTADTAPMIFAPAKTHTTRYR